MNRLHSIFRKLGSLLPGGTSQDASSHARVIRPWREDALHTYPVIGLTPSRMLALLQQADAGSPSSQYELFSEMLQRWPRLAAVESTRRMALAALDWEVVPCGSSNEANPRADAIVAHCREALQAVEGFREALAHLASAIGFGLAVAELVWEDGKLIDMVPVPHSRLTSEPNEPWRIRVRTQEEPTWGVPLDEQPFKWVVHQPAPAVGRPFESGLLRSSALLFLAQNTSLKDWLIYSQIAGMPVRVAQYEPNTPDSDKQLLLSILQQLGTDAVAVLSKNIELKLLEASRGGEKPYLSIQDYCNTEVTILWLGQHLTTDLRQGGSRAAAEVQDRVREDLLMADIAAESRTLRRDLLRPLVQARFGPTAELPHFRRTMIESTDTEALARTLSVAVRELGMRVPLCWAHKALGVPTPSGDEQVLTTGDGR